MLIIVPQGGLCNRLRVVLSALHVLRSAPTAAPLRICWRRADECGARFEDLFEPFSESQIHISGCPFHLRPVTRRNLHLPALWRTIDFDYQQKNFHASCENIFELLNKWRRLYISTCYPLTDYPVNICTALRLRPALQERVDRLADRFDSHTIGLHIRRTDHRESIRRSTDKAFFRAIDETIARTPETNFFLATDCADTKHRLLQCYGRRIFTHDAPLSRDNREGVEAAAVDLFTLARTSRLYGSWYSSFTDMAAEIGSIEKNVITR
ncbi:MAG: hypothetical protein J1F06_02730 [Prevotellaceae bacterium]|nr:hypothetical protein [Prevotellaceae bacterium]